MRREKCFSISYKPLMELLNTDVLFDVDLQGQGSMEHHSGKAEKRPEH